MVHTRNLKPLALCLLAVLLVQSACLANLPPRANSSDAIYTAAAQTIVAEVTLSGGQTAIAQLTQLAQGTPLPTQRALESPTPTGSSPANVPSSPTPIPPTDTPTPTATLFIPTATYTPRPPTATPTSIPCDWAQFVKDVTVPDGTVFLPGSMFTKVWRLKNVGSCAWNAGYDLVFSNGDRMGGRAVIPFPGIVRPGESVDLAVDLVAPGPAGKYRGYWMLSNPYGQVFGIGANAYKPFWVDIQVRATSSSYAYDFALNMCAATWRSSATSLECPGNPNSQYGSVSLLFDPYLENGRHENEQTLLTHPELARDGWIQGKYPPYLVESGDHFLADVGCLLDSPGCDVTFYLSYQVKNNPVKDLGTWHEAYDGKITRIDVDLSALADKPVSFILSVVNNGKSSAANAFWFVPSIRHGSAPPWWQGLRAVTIATELIAHNTGININQFSVTFAEQVTWSDTCLGVPQSGQVCAPAIVPGYRFLFSAGSRKFEAHTDLNGDTIFWFEL